MVRTGGIAAAGWFRAAAVCSLVGVLAAPDASAQALPLDSVPFERPSGLRGQMRDLFLFPLDRGDMGSGPGAGGRGFGPSAVGSTRLLINFIESAVASNLSNVPFASTNGSVRVTFENGVPVVSPGDPGPIVAERALTLGRGVVLVGASYNASTFTSIRGTSLSSLRLDFPHANLEGDECDLAVGGDCGPHGFPAFENDIMQVDLSLGLSIRTLSFIFSYGALDWLDVTAALPVVTARIDATSRAQIIPFGGPPATNYFGGTAAEPELLSDPRFVSASTSGVGDVAVRLKARIAQSTATSIAGLVEVRFPTGSAEDFLGSGQFVARALGVASAKFGDFSPHLNAGYLYRGGALLNDAVLGNLGFDQSLAPWATIAVDLSAQFQTGSSSIELPESVILTSPFYREVQPARLPEGRDDIIDASFGFKFPMSSGLVFVLNSTWPLNSGGVRASYLLGAGVEYSF